MISTANGFGCLGVSDVQGPPSSLWRKPMPNGKTAVLAINGAAIAHSITIDVATVLAPDRAGAGLTEDGKPVEATATDIWTGKALGKVSNVTRVVASHLNVFISLE